MKVLTPEEAVERAQLLEQTAHIVEVIRRTDHDEWMEVCGLRRYRNVVGAYEVVPD